ncbi:unnamed protein product, partial [Brenthis ino]
MGTVKGARPPSHTAYYVAMAGILTLLVMLCCYFLYFCIRRCKELASQPLPSPVKSVRPPPPTKPASYPVQPGVRESATAMARLCQLPPGHTDTVHPRRTSGERSSSLPPPRILSRSLSPHSSNSPYSTLSPPSTLSPNTLKPPAGKLNPVQSPTKSPSPKKAANTVPNNEKD